MEEGLPDGRIAATDHPGAEFHCEGGSADVIIGFGQNQYDLPAAVLQCMTDRHRIGHAAVVIRDAPDSAGCVDHRERAGRLDNPQVVGMNVLSCEVPGLSGFGIGGDNDKGNRVIFVSLPVHRIFSAVIAQCAVYVIQIDVILLPEEIFPAHIFLPACVFCIEMNISSFLPRNVSNEVRRACRNPQGIVEAYLMFHAVIQHACAENIPETASGVDDSVHSSTP